jgi:choice-of-anchor A domain-containing protein
MKQICVAVMVLLIGHSVHAGLELTKTVVGNLTQVPSGQQFTYRLSYRAASTTTHFYDVVLTDVLPVELDYLSGQGTSHATNITYIAGTRTLRAMFVNPLPAGSTGQIDFNVRFKRGMTPNDTTVTNQAVFSASNANSVTSAPVVIRATAGITLAASKTLVNPSVPLNDAITYTVKASTTTQMGALTITNITMIDQLPVGAVFVTSTSGGIYDVGTHAVTWRVGDIVPGTTDSQSRNVTIRYPESVFQLSNRVVNVIQVIGTPLGGDPVMRTAAITNTIVVPTAGITCVKAVPDNYVYLDKPATKTYSFNNVLNTGNTTLENLVLTDPIPPQIEVTDIYTGAFSGSPSGLATNIMVEYQTTSKGWTPVTGSPFPGVSSSYIRVSTLGLANNEFITALRWSFGALPATYMVASPKFNVRVLTSTDRDGNPVVVNQVITNIATLTYTDFTGDKTTTTSAPLTIRSPRPVIQLEKGLSTGTTIAHGGTGAFYIRLRNVVTAAQPLINPVMGDLLPAELTYLPGTYTIYRAPTNAPMPLFETINNYQNTGRTLLRWSWTEASAYSLQTNDYVEIRFQARQPVGTLYGSKSNSATLVGWGNAAIDQLSTSVGTDSTDIDNDGIKTDPAFYKTFSWTVPSDVAMDSQKWVKGTLDNDWSRYPDSASVPGGRADYRLLVSNSGNVPMRDIIVTDILPFVGDAGVVDLSARDSEWRPNLAGPVVAPSNAVVYYSTAENPTRTDFVESGPVGSSPANWTTNAPGNITRVRALRFAFQNYTLQPQKTMELTWPMRVPVGAPTGSNVAWNSFGFYGTRTDSGTTLLASEPLKVGVKTVMDINSAYGDRVWFDANKDGIQQSEELGVNGIRVELWEDSSEQSVPDGIINTNVDRFVGWTITGDDQDGNGGYFLFPNLTPGAYYSKFNIPSPYVVTTNNAISDVNSDSDIDPVSRCTSIYTLADSHRLFVSNIAFTVTSERLKEQFQRFGEVSEATIITDIGTGRSKGIGFVTMPDLEALNSARQQLNGSEFEGRQLVVEAANPERNFTFDAGIWLPPYGVSLVKTAGTAPDGDVWWTNINQTVVYAYTISNTGTLALVDIALSDDVLGTITNIAGPLAPGASRTVYASQPNLSVNVTNIATVAARPANAQGVEISGAPLAVAQDNAVVHLFSTLGGRVWNDLNANGIQDAGELGRTNVTVTLYDAVGTEITSTRTTADGSYVFRNLAPGAYQTGVTRSDAGDLFSPLGNGTATTDSDADLGTGRMSVVNLQYGESNLTRDGGIYRLASVGGQVWNDTDLDGVQDSGETGRSGVTLHLLDENGDTLSTTLSDADGNYVFADRQPGTYAVQIIVPNAAIVSAKDKGGNDLLDSDADPSTGRTETTELISDESDRSWDFGLFVPLPGVKLIKTAGTAADGATFSAQNGADVTYTYVVTNMGNTYLMPVTVTDDVLGMVGTLAQKLAPGAVATLTAIAHHVTTNTMNIATVTATPSDAYGRVLGANLTDDDNAYVTVNGEFGRSRVWLDDNRNGIQDLAEAGIPDVTVILYNLADQEVTNTTTDATGSYAFGTLPSGTYTIQFVVPPNYYLTLRHQGTDRMRDSDPDALTGKTGSIDLAGGATQAGWDAGLYRALPGVEIIKTAGGAADGTPFIVYGHGDVTYSYAIKNTGETHLGSIAVTDDKLGAIGTFAGPLAPDAQTVFTVTLTNVTAAVTNIATVTANPVDVNGEDFAAVSDVSDSDDAVVVILPRATLAGHVWVDAYRDGIRIPSEPGLLGVTVILRDATGSGIATNQTSSEGSYSFVDILPGDYRVQVLLPSTAWHFTAQDIGLDDTVDSDIEPVSGLTRLFTLASGEHANGWDAGVYGGLPPGFCSSMTLGQTFNAIIAGDFHASGGDTEGRLVIGGNAHFTNGYSVGIASVGEAIPPATPDIDRLIVGNNLYDGNFDVNGNIVYGGLHEGPPRYMTNNILRAVTPVTFTAEGNVPADGSGMSFDVIRERVRLASAMIGNMDDRGVTNVYHDAWSLLLQGDDPVLNVFNVQVADWNVHKSENVIDVPAGSTVIVNIHGTVATFSNGTIRLVGVATNNVLFNYVNATAITSKSIDHNGAVLAPYADAQLSGGAINGFAFFGGSITTFNGFEFHNFPFRGQICVENSSMPMIGLSVTAGDAPDGAILTVTEGTTVSLSYRITNNGSMRLSDVTVVDADFGVIGTLLATLAPGESALLVSPAFTAITNRTYSANVTGMPLEDSGEASTRFAEVAASDVAVVKVVPVVDDPAGGSGGGGGITSFNSVRPDFAVTAIDFVVKPTLTGEVFSAYVMIDNHGEVGADAGTLSLYLSEPTAVAPNTSGVATLNAGYLEPGESKLFVFDNLVAENVAGTHHLRAYVDSLNAVREWSDGDNQLAVTYMLNPIYMDVSLIPDGLLLRWNSFWGQQYTLLQCTNLTQAFEPFQTHVMATPPSNTFLIATPPPGGSFYKLLVEE